MLIGMNIEKVVNYLLNDVYYKYTIPYLKS